MKYRAFVMHSPSCEKDENECGTSDTDVHPVVIHYGKYPDTPVYVDDYATVMRTIKALRERFPCSLYWVVEDA